MIQTVKVNKAMDAVRNGTIPGIKSVNSSDDNGGRVLQHTTVCHRFLTVYRQCHVMGNNTIILEYAIFP